MKRLFYLLLLILTATATIQAQRPVHVQWSAEASLDSSGSAGSVVVTATIDPGWHIFGMTAPTLDPEAVAPQFTEISFSPSAGITLTAETTVSPDPVTDFDESLKLNLPMWEGTVTFTRHFSISRRTPTPSIDIAIEYMACTQKSCTPPASVALHVDLTPSQATTAKSEQPTAGDTPPALAADIPDTTTIETSDATVPLPFNSKWLYAKCLLLGFAGGLLAFAATQFISRFKKNQNQQ